MFVTLFCGILDIETGTFTFANAGHNPPILIGENGGHEFLKVKKGLVAGIMDNSRYPAETLQLAPGHTLLLYTDGVTEAMNTADDYYSEKRLLAAITGVNTGEPRALIDAVHADIFEFARNAPQADDITMFALRYRGAAPGDPVDAERV
jgi:sigma-B regulation protein RsbU (phosphoserine phosphatase)